MPGRDVRDQRRFRPFFRDRDAIIAIPVATPASATPVAATTLIRFRRFAARPDTRSDTFFAMAVAIATPFLAATCAFFFMALPATFRMTAIATLP
jgi:small neutral amino acid transporter SnatA (MarC family)